MNDRLINGPKSTVVSSNNLRLWNIFGHLYQGPGIVTSYLGGRILIGLGLMNV
jgi:hypothetical protein